jgi:hypothetical protein
MPILRRVDNHTTIGPITGMDIAWRESPPAETPPGTEIPYR